MPVYLIIPQKEDRRINYDYADMNGGETFDKLKEINPEVRVLLSSRHSLNGQAEDIINRGCSGFIQKPFNMNSFSVKLREILG